MKAQLLHNTRCSKSRAAVEYLDSKKVDFEIIHLLKEPLTLEELRAVVEKLKIKPSELIRKTDALFKDNFAGQNLAEEDYLKIMQENPSLIQRPILVIEDQAEIGRPLENFDRIL
ncbi:arsenate reductase (glutaredoxin) [Elizabethkingia sp. JS20170427COW]|nr:arsenate reductase (glutaredoxin) [Elizabethkingia sp. JS20170427COW]